MSSTNEPAAKGVATDSLNHWHPSISQNSSTVLGHFAPLSSDEQLTYKKWRRAAVIFYGAFALISIALSITLAPNGSTVSADQRPGRSSVASATQPQH